MSRVLLIGGAALAATLLAAPLLAQTGAPPPLSQEGQSLHLDALGHRIVMPFPDWLAPAERLSPDVAALVEANYFADPNQAFIEFFPRGESLDGWTTTYAARITRQPGRSLEDYRRATIFGYSRVCQPEATGMFLFGEQTPDFFPALGFICGAYLDSIPDLKGMGEVMVSVFRKTETGIAVIYQEWRGPAFDPYDPAGWPVGAEAFQARADQLQADAMLLAD